MSVLVKNICKMVYPGLEKMQETILFRSLGDQEDRQRVGCGFMFKPDITRDETDSLFSTYAIVYVLRGEGTYIGPDGISRPMAGGTLFQRFPGIRHSTVLNPSSNWAECFLDFGPGFYDMLKRIRVVRPEEYTLQLKGNFRIEQTIYRYLKHLEKAEERELPGLSLEMMQYAASLLQQAREGSPDHYWGRVEKSCRDFALLTSRRVDLKEYCRQNGWGYEKFRKSFVEKMGISPKHYLIQRRIDEACRLLRSNRHSVKEIAEILGYSSPFEFSAQFKRVTGVSPREFGRK